MPTTIEEEPDLNRLVALLASECHVPVVEMATPCERERAELASSVHIAKYLHIFATRNVLELLELLDRRKFD
jgi:hypothetical protein